jgi:hypothetical protein
MLLPTVWLCVVIACVLIGRSVTSARIMAPTGKARNSVPFFFKESPQFLRSKILKNNGSLPVRKNVRYSYFAGKFVTLQIFPPLVNTLFGRNSYSVYNMEL